jgi:hypothetical protein
MSKPKASAISRRAIQRRSAPPQPSAQRPVCPPSNAAATRSVTNPLRYPVPDVHYLVSTTRASLQGAKFDTRGQDEAKINETKDMLQGWLLVYLSPIRVCLHIHSKLSRRKVSPPPIRGNYRVVALYCRKGVYAYPPRSGTNIA